MDRTARRQAVRDYREATRPAGVFCVRCAATGAVFVDSSPNLAAQHNSLWFALRMGSARNRTLQAAWRDHGEAAFTFEVLETIDDPDLTPLDRADLLKSRAAHWRSELGALSALR